MTKGIAILALFIAFQKINSQGSLQFNQVLIVTSSSGQLSVPANKVWKITSQGTSGGIWYDDYSSNVTGNWTITNPHPCTGATSGSASVRYLRKRLCPTANNVLIINGTKSNMSANGPLWLPAGTTLSISTTPCVNTLNPNMSSNTPYFVYDVTGSGVTYFECAGSINTGVVPNSILASIIEFNIIP